jgi:hypothetical protein
MDTFYIASVSPTSPQNLVAPTDALDRLSAVVDAKRMIFLAFTPPQPD